MALSSFRGGKYVANRFKEQKNEYDEWKGWIIVNRILQGGHPGDSTFQGIYLFDLRYAMEIPYHDEKEIIPNLIVKCSVCGFTMKEKISVSKDRSITEEDVVNCYRSLRKDCPACATKFNSWKAWE